jgi:hypothetical protein
MTDRRRRLHGETPEAELWLKALLVLRSRGVKAGITIIDLSSVLEIILLGCPLEKPEPSSSANGD